MTKPDFSLYRQALQRDAGQCRDCGAKAEFVRHVVPLPKGGSNVLSNLASLCKECNRAIPYWRVVEHKKRIRETLAAAKDRGVKVGGLRPNTATRNDAARQKAQAAAERLRPILSALHAQGASLRQMAEALAAAGTTTRKGLPLSPSTVKLQLQRLGLVSINR